MRYFGQPRIFGMPLGTGSSGGGFGQYAASLNPIMWLPLNETSGSIATNVLYTDGVGPELLTNPGGPFTFTGDDPDGYVITNESAPGKEISEVGTGEAQGGAGTGYLNYAVDGASPTLSAQENIYTAGDTFTTEAVVDTLTAGNAKVALGSGSNNIILNSTGEFSSDHITANVAFQLLRNVTPTDLTIERFSVKKIGELDGLYNGPTVDNDTLLGQSAPTFDGVNDYVQLEYNRLESVFDPDEGTMVIAQKLSAAQRADANQYAAYTLGVDGNNFIWNYKNNSGNHIITFEVGNVTTTLSYALPASFDDKWVLNILRWNSAQNRVTIDTAGTQRDSDVYPAGTWTATALQASYNKLGSNNSSLFWPNALGQAQLYDRELTDNEVATLYNLFKARETNAA